MQSLPMDRESPAEQAAYRLGEAPLSYSLLRR